MATARRQQLPQVARESPATKSCEVGKSCDCGTAVGTATGEAIHVETASPITASVGGCGFGRFWIRKRLKEAQEVQTGR